MNFEDILEQQYEELFWEILNKETSKLFKDSKEYSKICHRCSEIIEMYPNLTIVLDDKKETDLNKNEVKFLLEYIELDRERNIIENKALLSAGGKNVYFILSKLELLKK